MIVPQHVPITGSEEMLAPFRTFVIILTFLTNGKYYINMEKTLVVRVCLFFCLTNIFNF
jgi:hypothetical protein